MTEREKTSSPSWFRGPGGRRFGRQFAAIILIKLAALILLWSICFRPYPRPDTAPAAMGTHLGVSTEKSDDQ